MNKIGLLIVSFVLLTSLACAFSAAPSKISAQPDARMSPALKNELENSPNPTETVKTTSAIVTAVQSLYIRSEPNQYSEVVGHLENGETVTVYECSGAWARIGAGQWVNSEYLSVRCK